MDNADEGAAYMDDCYGQFVMEDDVYDDLPIMDVCWACLRVCMVHVCECVCLLINNNLYLI